MGKKPNGYWQNWDNVERELRNIIEQEGEIPAQKRLSELGRNDLNIGIIRNHGGLSAVRERMGYELKRKPNGYWENWENVERELRDIIEENNGEFPSTGKLKKIGKSSLEFGVNKFHGGFSVVRERMGFDVVEVSDWKNEEYFLSEMEKVIAENKGIFPTQRRLYEMGKSGLSRAITKYYRGFSVVREGMGYELKRKPNGYWENWENVERELRDIIEENNGEFPSGKRLREMKKSSLGYFISKHYGGMGVVRKRMGFDLDKKPTEYWRDWNNIKSEIEKVIEKNNGVFPIQRRLIDLGERGLLNAIYTHYGSMSAVKERMGFGEDSFDSINALERVLIGYVEGEKA